MVFIKFNTKTLVFIEIKSIRNKSARKLLYTRVTIMKTKLYILILFVTTLGTFNQSAVAQSINLWRGTTAEGDWNNRYMWKLKHVPSKTDAVHFRSKRSIIAINSTIELGNGMHLYGQELTFEGNGNINMRSPIQHQRTINIPASSSGRSNLILTGNLSINAQISLAATPFGTSASKGTILLQDRTTVTGDVYIGSKGNGTGYIILRGESNYHIKNLVIDTLASKGGAAEIQIFGGTVWISNTENPFNVLLADSGRKIIIGDTGTLHIESNLPPRTTRKLLQTLLDRKQIIAAPDCQLGTPLFRDKTISITAEYCDLVAQPAGTHAAPHIITPVSPNKNSQWVAAPKTENSAKIAPKPTTATTLVPVNQTKPTMGYIVFLSAFLLLFLRPAPQS